MQGFTHTMLEIDTGATGYVEVEVGFTADFDRDDRPDLVSIDEVSVGGGVWLSLAELQANGLRTLAHEVALHLVRFVDTDDDVWETLREDAHERAIDDAAEHAYKSRRDF